MTLGEIHTAERLIAIALSGNPPQEIAEELKDLFVQINIDNKARRGIAFDEAKLQSLMTIIGKHTF
ncbi:hypothetical protein [Iningainema tapete]|uniref:hypothetical protein n=1 Tax=Iningainema tapete TaxID=2806730 RepID=UPI001EE2194C|nr:hypothetical protein [Iningainema tapete]